MGARGESRVLLGGVGGGKTNVKQIVKKKLVKKSEKAAKSDIFF